MKIGYARVSTDQTGLSAYQRSMAGAPPNEASQYDPPLSEISEGSLIVLAVFFLAVEGLTR